MDTREREHGMPGRELQSGFHEIPQRLAVLTDGRVFQVVNSFKRSPVHAVIVAYGSTPTRRPVWNDSMAAQARTSARRPARAWIGGSSPFRNAESRASTCASKV